MGQNSLYQKQLTAYARQQLKDLYVFAWQHVNGQENLKLQQQLKDLLAFACEEQLNYIGQRLQQQPDLTKFIDERHTQWFYSPHNPTFFERQKQARLQRPRKKRWKKDEVPRI